MTVQVSYIDSVTPGDYPLIIDYGEVVHIGASISNQSLSVGDKHNTSSRIELSDTSSVGWQPV